MFTSSKASLTSWKKKHITRREGRHGEISQRIFLVTSIHYGYHPQSGIRGKTGEIFHVNNLII